MASVAQRVPLIHNVKLLDTPAFVLRTNTILYHVLLTNLLAFDGTTKYMAPDVAARSAIVSTGPKFKYTNNSNGAYVGNGGFITKLDPIKPT